MKKEEINDLSNKMKTLKETNPLKFAELKGRIDATYEMQVDEPTRSKDMKGC